MRPSDDRQRIRARVSRACERCRMKKSKCDGARPCYRCNLDKTPCTYKHRKKPEATSPSQRYADFLVHQQACLAAGVLSLYSLCQKGHIWNGGPVEDVDGKPSVHRILELLGVIDADEDDEGEDEDRNGHEADGQDHEGDDFHFDSSSSPNSNPYEFPSRSDIERSRIEVPRYSTYPTPSTRRDPRQGYGARTGRKPYDDPAHLRPLCAATMSVASPYANNAVYTPTASLSLSLSASMSTSLDSPLIATPPPAQASFLLAETAGAVAATSSPMPQYIPSPMLSRTCNGESSMSRHQSSSTDDHRTSGVRGEELSSSSNDIPMQYPWTTAAAAAEDEESIIPLTPPLADIDPTFARPQSQSQSHRHQQQRQRQRQQYTPSSLAAQPYLNPSYALEDTRSPEDMATGFLWDWRADAGCATAGGTGDVGRQVDPITGYALPVPMSGWDAGVFA